MSLFNMKLRLISAFSATLTVLTLSGVLAIGPGQTASAAPGAAASCMGHEMSEINPPGSNPEFLGGSRELLAMVDTLGFPNRGAVIKLIASLHSGSHESCDAELEG